MSLPSPHPFLEVQESSGKFGAVYTSYNWVQTPIPH